MNNPLISLVDEKFKIFDKQKHTQISFKSKIGEMDFSAYLFIKSNTKKLYVMLSGALSSTRETSFTYHRWSWNEQFDGSVLYISDPVLSNNLDLNIGWYIGTEDYPLDTYIAEFVVSISKKINVNLDHVIAYGSSAGGYAAMQLATNIGHGALAVAINPQTNIFKYLEKPVNDLISKVWVNYKPNMKDPRFNLLNKSLNYSKILYIQNKSDISHYENHMIPFLKIDSRKLSNNIRIQKGSIRLIEYDHPSGHAAEPKEMLPEIFESINYMIENVSYSKNKFFILGSCVSRDVFLPKYRSEIGSCGYYPRTTFARLALEEVDQVPEFNELSSPFQRKIVQQDFNLNVLDSLSNTDYDYILIDLIDDRYGLVEFENTYVTNSFELNSSKVLNSLDQKRIISAESDDFIELWTKGFNKFLEYCISNNIQKKIVLNRVYWAEKLDNGKEFANISNEKISKNNLILTKLYKVISDLVSDLHVIDYPEDLILAKNDHKWGIMPFHYVDEFYEYSYKKLKDLNNS